MIRKSWNKREFLDNLTSNIYNNLNLLRLFTVSVHGTKLLLRDDSILREVLDIGNFSELKRRYHELCSLQFGGRTEILSS